MHSHTSIYMQTSPYVCVCTSNTGKRINRHARLLCHATAAARCHMRGRSKWQVASSAKANKALRNWLGTAALVNFPTNAHTGACVCVCVRCRHSGAYIQTHSLIAAAHLALTVASIQATYRFVDICWSSSKRLWLCCWRCCYCCWFVVLRLQVHKWAHMFVCSFAGACK